MVARTQCPVKTLCNPSEYAVPMLWNPQSHLRFQFYPQQRTNKQFIHLSIHLPNPVRRMLPCRCLPQPPAYRK